MSVVWLWYCIKSRNAWFFTTANPSLTFGGFEGEGKWEMYQQLPPDTYPKTVLIPPNTSVEQLEILFEQWAFQYPVAVKPDIGMKGLLVRKIDNAAQLMRYNEQYNAAFLIQEWIDLPVELGVFYFRYPGETQGRISGVSSKELVHVYGNGHATLLELMECHPRAGNILNDLIRKHAFNLNKTIPLGQKYQLTVAANRGQGTKMEDMSHEIDAAMTGVLDRISLYSGQLYWGRFDIKCASIEDFKQGKNFKILEFNGAGAAPSHIYQAGLSFGSAWAEVAMNWRALYEISQINHKKGIAWWSFCDGIRFLYTSSKHFKQLKKLENEL